MKHLRRHIRGILLEFKDDISKGQFVQATVGDTEYASGPSTIGGALELLKQRKEDSRLAQFKDLLMHTGKEAPKAIPLWGTAIVAGEIAKKVFHISKNEAPDVVEEIIKDYPLLDLWDINYMLFKVVDNGILEGLEDDYEEEFLTDINPETPIALLPDINDWIIDKIKEMYGISMEIEG